MGSIAGVDMDAATLESGNVQIFAVVASGCNARKEAEHLRLERQLPLYRTRFAYLFSALISLFRGTLRRVILEQSGSFWRRRFIGLRWRFVI